MSENHKERSNYQQGMDAIHLSEEKAGETLRMMLVTGRGSELWENTASNHRSENADSQKKI